MGDNGRSDGGAMKLFVVVLICAAAMVFGAPIQDESGHQTVAEMGRDDPGLGEEYRTKMEVTMRPELSVRSHSAKDVERLLKDHTTEKGLIDDDFVVHLGEARGALAHAKKKAAVIHSAKKHARGKFSKAKRNAKTKVSKAKAKAIIDVAKAKAKVITARSSGRRRPLKKAVKSRKANAKLKVKAAKKVSKAKKKAKKTVKKAKKSAKKIKRKAGKKADKKVGGQSAKKKAKMKVKKMKKAMKKIRKLAKKTKKKKAK